MNMKEIFKKKPNYYEILGIEDTATTLQIESAISKRADQLLSERKYDELKELTKIADVLINEESRKKYDRKIGLGELVFDDEVVDAEYEVQEETKADDKVALDENQDTEAKDEEKDSESKSHVDNVNVSWFQKAKPYIAGTLAGLMIGGVVFSLTRCSSEKVDTPSTTITEVQDETKEFDKVQFTETFDSNIDAVVDENATAGLNTTYDVARAAYYIANAKNYTEEEIIAINEVVYDDIDFDATNEYAKSMEYVVAILNHNLKSENYISLVDLIENETDRQILTALENEYITLVEKSKNGTLTKEKYQASYDKVIGFYKGIETMGNYTNNFLTAGGANLAIQGYWPQFTVAYLNSPYQTKEIILDIQTLTTPVKDGDTAKISAQNHVIAITEYVTDCLSNQEEIGNEKTLTK